MRKQRRAVEAPHLQLLHLACPATAFLTVDAADGQRKDLLLQLWIWVDLRKQGRRNSSEKSKMLNKNVTCAFYFFLTNKVRSIIKS